jgi:hypothetical protein
VTVVAAMRKTAAPRILADLAFGVAFVALPTASLFLTDGSGLIQTAFVSYAAMVVLSVFYPAVGVVFTMLVLFAQLTVYGETLKFAWLDVRYLAPPVIAAMAFRALWQRVHHPGSSGAATNRQEQALAVVVRAILPLVVALGFTSLLWSVNPTGTMNRSIGLLAAAVFCGAAARILSIDDITRVLATLGWLIVTACVTAWLLFPAVAVENGRLRGLFANANGLAAFLVVISPVILVRLGRLRWPVAIALSVVCVATGSRTGCAGVAMELLVFTVAARTVATRVIALLLGGVVAGLLVLRGQDGQFFSGSPIPLLRSNDSRSEEWAEGLRHFHAHPLTGVGLGALPSGSIAGLIPELLATAGAIGAAIIGCFMSALIALAMRAQAMFMSLVVGAVVDVFFEPWLFAGGSMLCAVFWVVILHPESLQYTGRRHAQPDQISDHLGRLIPAAGRR